MDRALTRDERVMLTRSAFRLLDAWSVPPTDQSQLLGLASGLKRRELNRHRLGTPFSEEGDHYRRIGLLLRIDNILRKLFPHSELSANLWVTTANPRYGGLTPLDTMRRDGLAGIERVERSLNSPESW